VVHAAVHHVSAPHTGRERRPYGRHFGHHPAADHSGSFETVQSRQVALVHHSLAVAVRRQHPRHVGEQQQLLRLQRGGQRPGCGVGIHIEGLTGLVGGDARHHGDDAGGKQFEHPRVHAADLPHQPHVDREAVLVVVGQRLGNQQAAVFP